VASHSVHLLLPWLEASGETGPATADFMTLEPNGLAAIPELAFSPGRYGLTISTQAPASAQLRSWVEGDPSLYRVSATGTAAEPRADFLIPEASRRRIVIESTPQAGRVSPSSGGILIRDLWLQEIVPLPQFLSAVERTLKNKIAIIIAAGREARRLLRPPHLEPFRKPGLPGIDNWKSSPADVFYAALLKDGRLVFKRAGNTKLIFQNKRLRVYAGNNRFQTLIDGVDYAQAQDGLNIVVVDGSDISSHFCRARWDDLLLV
jgi:hypothetical protein